MNRELNAFVEKETGEVPSWISPTGKGPFYCHHVKFALKAYMLFPDPNMTVQYVLASTCNKHPLYAPGGSDVDDSNLPELNAMLDTVGPLNGITCGHHRGSRACFPTAQLDADYACTADDQSGCSQCHIEVRSSLFCLSPLLASNVEVGVVRFSRRIG